MSPRPPAEIPQQQVSHIRVDPDHAGRRIDNFLLALLSGVPKSRIYSMLRKGEVRINGRRAGPETRLAADDMVRVPPVRHDQERPAAVPERTAEALKPRILHEDRGLMVVDKPAGMAVHGGSGIRFGVIESLRHLRRDTPYLELVHRLDRDTSGCLMVAKKPSVLRRLHEALRVGTVGKRYLTLLRGRWPAGERVVRERLRKHALRGGERLVEVAAAGKESVSRFRLLEDFGMASLVEVRLETGRTHQIRVHAAHHGHPVAADGKYGDAEFNRLMKDRYGLRRLFLHASSLRIPADETGGATDFEAPLPAELVKVIDALRQMKSASRPLPADAG